MKPLLLALLVGAAPAKSPAALAEGQEPELSAMDSLPRTPSDAPSTPPFRWEVPGLLNWVDSAGPQLSNGMPVILQMARSKNSLESLLQHFATSFEKAGLYVPPGPEQLRVSQEPQLSALDPERMLSYSVILQPNLDGTVTVILGTADLSQYDAAATSLGWAPLPPDATKVMRTETEDAQSAVFATTGTKEEVMAFYRKKLGGAGFQEAEPGLFLRGGEHLRVFTHHQEGQLMVGLTRRLGGSEQAPSP